MRVNCMEVDFAVHPVDSTEFCLKSFQHNGMKASLEEDDSEWELSVPEKMEKSNRSWVDITHDFEEACRELKLGELLHDKLFGLFEGMSAIEMMDPKMDGNQVNRKVLNFEQAIKDGTIKIKDLTLPEMIGIMDTCFCCLREPCHAAPPQRENPATLLLRRERTLPRCSSAEREPCHAAPPQRENPATLLLRRERTLPRCSSAESEPCHAARLLVLSRAPPSVLIFQPTLR